MRFFVAMLCVVLFPVALPAQAPDPALAAAATLDRMSHLSAPTFWSGAAALDSAVATDTKKKKDKKALGLGLMIVGVGAIIGGVVVTADGNNGGLALIIAGGVMEGAGYQLYHGGSF
jgi:hypothetical protein